jgi:hypothetical protein
MKEEQMPGPNERMKEIVRHYSDGNVKNFVTSLEDISHQTVNRIFNIDSRSGKYPGVSSDIIAAVAKAYPEIDINWLITGAGSMLRENTLVETNREKDLDSKTTQNILFILAETVKDQAATRREQMELMKTHGRILESIESKMAREITLADVALNLQRVFGGVETMGERQEAAIKTILSDLNKIKAQTKVPS